MKEKRNFLLVTLEGGGNVPPVFGLAKRLVQHGHNVHVLTEPCMEDVVKFYGCKYIPFQEYFTRKDRTVDLWKDWNASMFSDPAMDNVIFGSIESVVSETREALKMVNADVLIADCMLPASTIAAESLDIPTVMLFHFPEYFPGPNRPPGFMGLLPGKGFFGKMRDKLLSKVFDQLFNKFLPKINEVRATYSLNKLESVVELIHNVDLRFIQTLKEFDFPIEPAPANVRYTGAVLDDPDWTDSWSNPWEEDDPRPLVVISLSSTFQNQKAAIQNAINALKDLDVRGLVTLGLAMDHEKFEAPKNVVVLKSAPHSQVFPLADLVITHAGHGTIMRALSHGLPLICLPMGRDQDDNAAKIAYHGCGLKLSPKASPEKIKRAINIVLKEQRFRQRAIHFQNLLQKEDSMDVAILELENLKTSKPLTVTI